MKWIEYQQSEGERIPVWKRRLDVSEESGEVFVPAAMAGELTDLLCSMYDVTTDVNNHHHAYAPVIWLAREFPNTKALCDIMTARARQTLGAE